MASLISSVMNSSPDSRKSSHDLVVSHAAASHAVTLSSSGLPEATTTFVFKDISHGSLFLTVGKSLMKMRSASRFFLCLSLRSRTPVRTSRCHDPLEEAPCECARPSPSPPLPESRILGLNNFPSDLDQVDCEGWPTHDLARLRPRRWCSRIRKILIQNSAHHPCRHVAPSWAPRSAGPSAMT